MTDLKRTEKIHRIRAAEAQQQVVTETKLADDALREINFRTIPEAQNMQKDIRKLKTMLENHTSGKKPLTKAKYTAVMKAIKATEKALGLLLLYGSAGYTYANTGGNSE